MMIQRIVDITTSWTSAKGVIAVSEGGVLYVYRSNQNERFKKSILSLEDVRS